MKKIVIFDMDGTLLNTINDLADSSNTVLERYNFPTHSVEEYKYFVGNGLRVLVERMIPDDVKHNDEIITTLFNELSMYYATHDKIKTAPYNGIIEILNLLSFNNIHIAIASNKIQNALEDIAAHFFKGINFFDIKGNRPDFPVKPDPKIVFEILRQGNFSKEDAIFVGDTSVDINTAKSAGIESVGVLWGFRTEQELIAAKADHIISSPSELITIIKK